MLHFFTNWGQFNNTFTSVIINSTRYLFSDWRRAYSEFSKSVPGTSFICRSYNNHGKDTQGHGQSCHAWPRCMIFKGNHGKFAHFVLFAVNQEAKTWLPGVHSHLPLVTISFPFNAVIKQLLDSVFGMSRIIKVSLRLITLPRPWLLWISQKPNPIVVYNLQL